MRGEMEEARSALATPAVRVHGASKRFGTVQALRGTTLEIRRGELVALLGPNGSGKTTLVNAIVGLLALDAGEVSVFGHAAGTQAARECISVMLQTAAPPEMLRVRELIELFRGYHHKPLALDAVLGLADLRALAERRYGQLSGGEKRRVQFAMTVASGADLIVLDEPTTHMDAASRNVFWSTVRSLREAGHTILLVTHQMEEVDALADRVLLMAHGVVIRDSTVDALRGAFSLTRISCVAAFDPAWPLTLPGVVSVRSEGRKLMVLTADRDATVRAMLSAQPNIAELSVEPASLEDAIARVLECETAAVENVA